MVPESFPIQDTMGWIFSEEHDTWEDADGINSNDRP